VRVAGADRAVGNVLAWATGESWAEEWSQVLDGHLAAACDDLGISVEALETALDEDAYGIVFACAMEDFLSRSFGAARGNVVDAYLQRRGWRESASGKVYLRALRGSILSLYEVVDVVPGRHLVVRDLIRGGAALQVDERLGSQNTARWDRLALRLLSLGGKLCLAGGAYHFPHEAASLLLDAVERTAKQERSAARRRAKREGQPEDVPLQRIKQDLLPDLAPIFTRSWLLLTLGHAAPPRLVNFDGHDLVFTEVRYPILPDAAAEIERRLDRAPSIERDVAGEPAWTWLRQETRPAVAPARQKEAAKASALSYDSESEDGRWTFARIELRCADLLLTCNSVERADVARARLAGLLDGLVGPPLTAMQTMDQALADHQARQGERDAAAETVPPEIAGPVLRQFMDEHYRRCLNQPIGVLDGKTPRQAVRSRKGREQVVTWLKYLENGTARRARHDPSAAYDFGWMWAELGIADRRQ
jgi:hypothetical protein